MSVSLDTIIAATRRRVAGLNQGADWRELERQAEKYVPRGFRKGLERAAKSGVAVIAELKKASPSRGLIRRDVDPALLATELENAGAAALPVLTDEAFCQDSLQHLR